MSLGGGVKPKASDEKPALQFDMDALKANATAFETLVPMGITSENVAERYGITREMQDEMAVLSNQKAVEAIEKGYFKNEIVPITTKNNGVVDTDQGPRKGTTLEGLAKLKPAFKKGGASHAGNSSQVSDGAGAAMLMTRSKAQRLGLKPIGVFRGFSVVGVKPDEMGIGPAEAIPAVLNQTGLAVSDIDVYEINEAFASQAVYSVKKLGIPMAKVNPNGGAIALGHPLGATGARQVATLMHQLQRTKQKLGVISMCIGTGMGAAAVIEAEH
jgi:acetyl-CoA acyltransferase 1